MRLLIANGYVVDPSQGLNAGKNLLLEDGRVTGVLDRGEAVPNDTEISMPGFTGRPGFVDLHSPARAGAGIQRGR